jgi:hypothetical protein
MAYPSKGLTMNNVMRVGYSLALVLLLAVRGSADDREVLKPFAEKALQAIGGEKVQKVRAWSIILKETEKVGGQEEAWHSGTTHLYVQLPDLYRSEFQSKVLVGENSIPDRTIVVVNGQKGWRHESVTGETEELSAKDIDAYKRKIRRSLWLRGGALLSDPGYELKALPKTRIGDREAIRVKLTHKEYPPIRLYFDKETALLLKSERNQDDDRSLDRTVQTTYSDYRRVSGILVPHKQISKAEGPERNEIQLDGIGTVKIEGHISAVHRLYELVELRFVDKLDAKLFEKP